ncbi:hypothetical protein [Alicyclobacillus fodiniaquatilis]|uniref:Uncharacterized protein n=1 Tax=Alicyclobacillus fodiniaquatilis TaxID=1661150 RepID=A0ABW4JK29_9BACL
MEEFEGRMKEIQAAAHVNAYADKGQATEAGPIVGQLEQLLQQLANRAKKMDAKLEIKVTGGESPGLVAGFVNAHFSTMRYILTSKCSDGQVEVDVQDGEWKEMSNVHGLWGNWLDKKTVYHGEFLEAPIREAIERTFMHWYEKVKLNAQKGIPLQ